MGSHQEALAQHRAAEEARSKLASTLQELSKERAQAALKKKQGASALRRADAEADMIKRQLNEALREGQVGRADAMFARLPYSLVTRPDEDLSNGQWGEALNEENGELRALLAAVYMRVRELCPTTQDHTCTSVFELPVALGLPAIRDDFEAAFADLHNQFIINK